LQVSLTEQQIEQFTQTLGWYNKSTILYWKEKKTHF